MAFTESLSFDRRLWPDDIAGSVAHVLGLANAEIITEAEAAAIIAALEQVADEMGTGTFSFVDSDEDIHTAIERRVTELAGPTGAKLHTGRSRNDQAATDVRLWMKRELMMVARRIIDLQTVLLDRARSAGDIYLPGYTHLQRAQPVLLAHHLCSLTAGRSAATSSGSSTRSIGSTCRRSVPARWRARRCRSIPTFTARRARLRSDASRTRSTRSDRAITSPRRSSP